MSNTKIPTGTASLVDNFPSREHIDDFNSARQDPKYLVLDDINIDLITVFTVATSVISIFLLNFSSFKVLALAAAILVPLRAFLPQPTTPKGLTLITGASSGIGAELAYIFARNGHDLILVGRNEDQLDAVRKNIKTNAHVVVTDLSAPGAPKKLYEHVKSQGYVVSVLVNDAGLGHGGDSMNQSAELSEQMIALNCTAVVVLTQLFGKDMIQRGEGWILQVSSIVGRCPYVVSVMVWC